MLDAVTEGIRQLRSGGFLMIPLLICSIIAHTIILERLYSLRRSKLIPQRFISRIYRIIEKGDPDLALSLCEEHPGPLTNILKVGIENRHLSDEEIRSVLKVAAYPERAILRKHLSLLNFLASVSVLMGLFGTVLGLFGSFSVIFKHYGPETTSMIAGGVSVALLTTVAGLSVAMPSLIAYSYFSSKVESIINEMTRHSISLVKLLEEYRSRLLEEAQGNRDEVQ